MRCTTFQTPRDLDQSHEQDLNLRAGEYVSVGHCQEVMTWVLESDPVDARHHIPGLSPTLHCDEAITEVETTSSTKPKAGKKGGHVQKIQKRKWVTDVPGIALVGEYLVDPPEDGEASLGICYVVPRPRRFVTTTTQTFYKPYRYTANNRKQPERSLTTEVREWVELSSGTVDNMKSAMQVRPTSSLS